MKFVIRNLIIAVTLTFTALSCQQYEMISQDISTYSPCEKVYKPVCGSDNITYQNECFAAKAGVLKWNPGKCK